MSGHHPAVEAVKLLTFDCYGTLIDWESGIRSVLSGQLQQAGLSWSAEMFDWYLEAEAQLECRDYQSYKAILTHVENQFYRRTTGMELSPRLASSVGKWLPFPDTVETLQRLKQRFQLAVLSNIDRDLFQQSARHLKVSFDWVVTAEDVRAYKPSPAHFEKILKMTGYSNEHVLHVAQSRYHDIQTCNMLSIPAVWINRRQETGTDSAVPMATFPDLKSFADDILGS